MISKNINQWLLLASLTAIILVTTYPFDFVVPQQLSRTFISESFHYTTTIKDYGRNILLFIPWGFFLAKFILDTQDYRWKIILVSFCLSAIISSNIELIQILLPSRTSSLSDIICNALGGTIGSSLYYWRKDFISLLRAIIHRDYRSVNLKFILVVTICYIATVSMTVSIFIANINFSNWHDDYYLAIGGEVTGQIHWQGYINSLHIGDRALTNKEINTAFRHTHSLFSRLPSTVISLLLLEDKKVYPNIAERSPDFIWQSPRDHLAINANNTIKIGDQQIDELIHRQKQVLFKPERNLISVSPVTQLNQRIKRSQEFSLSIILASALDKQPWPSRRIVSIANDIYTPNLLLAQSGTDLVFRLRTPTTSTIANQPFFRIPNVFNDLNLHQIIITFAHRQLTFYIDRPNNKYTFDFQPATHLKLYSPLFFKEWSVNLKRYSLLRDRMIFFILIFFPLAILIILMVSTLIQK